MAAVFRKRLPSTEDPDDATAAAPSKRAKLDHDDRGCTGPALAAAPAETRVGQPARHGALFVCESRPARDLDDGCVQLGRIYFRSTDKYVSTMSKG